MTIEMVEKLVEGLLDEIGQIDPKILNKELVGTTVDDIGRLEDLLTSRLESKWPAVAQQIRKKVEALKREQDRQQEEAKEMQRQKAQQEASGDDDFEP